MLYTDEQAVERLNSRRAAATAMIGELNRYGRQVFYVTLPGGEYREQGSRYGLVAFLMRENIV